MSKELEEKRKRWADLLDAVRGAEFNLLDITTGYDESIAAALAHLAPFFAQGVHSGTPVTENHVTDGEVVVPYPHAVCSSGDGWVSLHSGQPGYPVDGPVFHYYGLGPDEWERELDAKLDPQAVYDLELRLRKRKA